MLRRAGMALLMLAMGAVPAAADWLVMGDGTRVETRGPWRQDGRLLVFTSPDDRLVSLRSSSVDLPASVEATRQAAEAATRAQEGEDGDRERPQPPPRQSRRITNADVGPGVPTPPGRGEGEVAAVEAGEPAAAPGRGALDIVDSRQSTDEFDGHLIVTGSVVNRSGQTAAAVGLTVLAYGADGELLGSQRAALTAEALAGGEGTTFQVDFPEVFSAFALRFVPEASFLEVVPEREAPDDGTR
jgi:hypothetical protein